MMKKVTRIGTRESPLAMVQAEMVTERLRQNGYATELVPVKSGGDLNLVTPLYEIGVQGIFTKELDTALLENSIGIAVHSLKDIPVQPAKGITIAAILERESPFDVLVCKDESVLQRMNAGTSLKIATSSIRRKAQWLFKYPASCFENIRGNVGTRLRKLHESGLDGVVFAAAGLKRLNLSERETGPQILLDWMLPAPGQGAIAVCCREGDETALLACKNLNHEQTNICATAERELLRLLKGGCSTPIGALATIHDDQLLFRGNITSTDGQHAVHTIFKVNLEDHKQVAERAANDLISKGGLQLLKG
jgi:hydroxymethylbilane synthase